MNKILVTSDTHGHVAALRQAIVQAGEFTYFVHLGDCTADVEAVRPLLEERGVPVYQVRGNCDYSGAELYWEFHLDGQKIAMLHGHTQRVKYSLLSLGLLAEQKQADAVLFGHTHIPKVEYSSTGRLLFNPGSLGEPRLGRATFGLLLLSRDGIMPRIVQLDAVH